jgi:plastocyanin
MRRPVYLALGLLLVLALALTAACGGDDSSSDDSNGGDTAAAEPTESPSGDSGDAGGYDIGYGGTSGDTTASPTAGESAGNAVTIQGRAFQPARLTVPVGTTVTWTNQDSEPHTATSEDGSTFDSGSMSNGQTFEHTFTTAGEYAYVCEFHSDMTATIVVQ